MLTRPSRTVRAAFACRALQLKALDDKSLDKSTTGEIERVYTLREGCVKECDSIKFHLLETHTPSHTHSFQIECVQRAFIVKQPCSL